MTQIGRRFGLSDQAGSGVFCGENGLFVGAVPLLERVSSSSFIGDNFQWAPRPVDEINQALEDRYGLPIEFGRKAGCLSAIAKALNRGDILHARIATAHLELPDPPHLRKSAEAPEYIIGLARQLRASGLLKADWDPAKHPRWPAGSPAGIGGEFAPVDAMPVNPTTAEPSAEGGGAEQGAMVIPAQMTLPVPLELPDAIPFPSEVMPPPAIPDIYPRELQNSYPNRAGCDEEWAEAIAFCKALAARNQLGRGDYRGSGKSLYQCIMGQVSERCGGNSIGA